MLLPMEITLVRHAQSIWNAEDRWQGQSDVPLSDKGRAEAEKVALHMQHGRFERVVASDLSRAADTARAITSAQEGAPAVELRAGLREMNLGAWCGLPHAEVVERFPEELKALQHGAPMRIGGTGESLPEFADRVMGELAAIREAAKETDRILVVTHGGVIRAVMFALLDLAGRERPLIGTGNTGVTLLVGGKRSPLSVRVYNDQRHLGLFTDEGDHVLAGPAARGELISSLELKADAPLLDLSPVDRVVLHRQKSGRTQLRRYGVMAPLTEEVS